MTWRLPDWLVIGASKAGTSSMAVWMHAHSLLHVSGLKEVRFFDTDANFEKGPEWYGNQFSDPIPPRPEQFVGELTPSYLWHPKAPERIAQLLPKAKLIAMLRHPVDRFHSQYWHMRGWTQGDFPEVEDVAKRALAGDPEVVDLVERGHYAEQIGRYDRLFPADALHVVMFEQVRDTPEEAFLSITRHIGVPDEIPKVIGKVVNRTHTWRSHALHDAMVRHRAWERSLRISRAIDRMNTRFIDYPPLPSRVRAELLEHYAPHTTALEDRLGTKLPDWFK